MLLAPLIINPVCLLLKLPDNWVIDEQKRHRFLTAEQAAEEMNVSTNQIRALLKTGELRAIQVGGRGMWRIGVNDLEDYITEAYRRTAERIAAGDIVDDVQPDADDAQ